jgi:hypothetical protein
MIVNFSQQKLDDGYALMVLEPEENERFSDGEGIVISRITATGEDYLGAEKAIWSGKKEVLKVSGKIQDGKLVFNLEPFYVNNLSQGGYCIYLFDKDGNDTGIQGDVFINGVRKSQVLSGGFGLSAENVIGVKDESDETIASIAKLTEDISAKIRAITLDINNAKKVLLMIDDDIRSGNGINIENDYKELKDLVFLLNQKKTELDKLSAMTQQSISSSKVTSDVTVFSKAKALVDESGSKISQLENDFLDFMTEVEEYKPRYETFVNELKTYSCEEGNPADTNSAEDLPNDVIIPENNIDRAGQSGESLLNQGTDSTASQTDISCDSGRVSENGSQRCSTKKGFMIVGGILLISAVVCGGYLLAGSFIADKDDSEKVFDSAKDSIGEKEEKLNTEVTEQEKNELGETESLENKSSGDLSKRVSSFLRSDERDSVKAMELADDLDPKTPEEQDLVFKLYYLAAMRGHERGSFKYAECLDPTKPDWGSIKKDPVEAWEYYGMSDEGEPNRQNLKEWVKKQADNGDFQAKQWLQKLN